MLPISSLTFIFFFLISDPGIPSNDAAAQKDSGRTKSFYVIVGIATAIAVVFAFLIALLIYFLRRDKKDDKAPQKISLSKSFTSPQMRAIKKLTFTW